MRSLVFTHLRAILLCTNLLLISSIPEFNFALAQEEPIAIDDKYSMLVDCNNDVIAGNLLDNDLCDKSANIEVAFVVAPKVGLFSCGPAGNFVYIVGERFNGIVEFRYRIQNKENNNLFSDASVIISIKQDSDCDEITDDKDIDCDNDGILDIHEGMGNIDTDGDGIPDCFDIDSDNDGITDIEEWQHENARIPPLLKDENHDGWDDAFDSEYGGDYYPAVDTDQDGTPDYLDPDSDNDSFCDFKESFASENYCPECVLSGLDYDHDGLDNIFDTISCCAYQTMTILSSSPLPDSDMDNVRDWRDDYNSVGPINNPQSEGTEDKPFVYPNPVNESCTVVLVDLDMEENQQFDVKLYTEYGKLVLHAQKQQSAFQLKLNQLPGGSYFLRVDTNQKTYKTKLIKL